MDSKKLRIFLSGLVALVFVFGLMGTATAAFPETPSLKNRLTTSYVLIPADNRM